MCSTYRHLRVFEYRHLAVSMSTRRLLRPCIHGSIQTDRQTDTTGTKCRGACARNARPPIPSVHLPVVHVHPHKKKKKTHTSFRETVTDIRIPAWGALWVHPFFAPSRCQLLLARRHGRGSVEARFMHTHHQARAGVPPLLCNVRGLPHADGPARVPLLG